MGTQIQFITAVLHAEVLDALGAGILISENLFLSNDATIPRRMLDRQVAATIGELEFNQLLGSRLFVYGEWSDERDMFDYDHMKIFAKQIPDFQAFFFLMWMIRDNCAESELSFLIERTPNATPRISSNTFSHTDSKHDAKTAIDKYSREELIAANDKFGRRIQGYASDGAHSQLEILKGQGRISRAFQFVLAARGTTLVFLKVANYCSALEALFCTDSHEITHKLAERVAFFTGKTPEEKLKIFNKIKRAYSLRSKIIHGSTVKVDACDLIEISASLDNILREILNRIMIDKTAEDFFSIREHDVFEKRIAEMVFGSQP